MAIIIHPDGKIEERPWEEAKEIFNRFDCIPGLYRAGYLGIVDDDGCLTELSRNTIAETVCEYRPIFGTVVLATLEEAGEEELVGQVDRRMKEAFDSLLNIIHEVTKTVKEQCKDSILVRIQACMTPAGDVWSQNPNQN